MSAQPGCQFSLELCCFQDVISAVFRRPSLSSSICSQKRCPCFPLFKPPSCPGTLRDTPPAAASSPFTSRSPERETYRLSLDFFILLTCLNPQPVPSVSLKLLFSKSLALIFLWKLLDGSQGYFSSPLCSMWHCWPLSSPRRAPLVPSVLPDPPEFPALWWFFLSLLILGPYFWMSVGESPMRTLS